MKWRLGERFEQWYIAQCIELGINVTRLTSIPQMYADSLKEDEAIALDYITNGKEVPEDIRKRLIETKDMRMPYIGKSVRIDPHQYDDLIKQIVGDKFTG